MADKSHYIKKKGKQKSNDNNGDMEVGEHVVVKRNRETRSSVKVIYPVMNV